MTNPFESHPLYRYRRLLLILSAASFVLCVFALADGSSQTYVLHIVAIALSTLLIIYDLVRFALGQTQDAAERPPWPVRKIMWGDAFLVLLFFFAFIGDSTGPYSYYSFPWYGYTSALSIFSMIIHARCFWAQYMAFQELRWLRQLQKCNSIYQCDPCQQNHALLHCQTPEAPPPSNRSRAPERRAPRDSEEDIVQPIFPIPPSWLPACIRPKQTDLVDDIEATAESPNESTRLITPLSDDVVPYGGSRGRSQSPESRTDHEESEVVVVKKKSKKKGKKATVESDNGEGSSSTPDLLGHGRDF